MKQKETQGSEQRAAGDAAQPVGRAGQLEQTAVGRSASTQNLFTGAASTQTPEITGLLLYGKTNTHITPQHKETHNDKDVSLCVWGGSCIITREVS